MVFALVTTSRKRLREVRLYVRYEVEMNIVREKNGP